MTTFTGLLIDNNPDMDWPLLKEQKKTLLDLCDNPTLTPEQIEHLSGIINLIDTIQDTAVDELGIPEGVVFKFGEN